MKKFCLIVTLAAAALSNAAGDSRATQLLLNKARALEARGRLDLAAQTWRQVLSMEPAQEDALAGLARAAKQAGRTAEARGYLERLKKLNPKHPAIPELEAQRLALPGQAQLEQAAKLAQAGKYDAAVEVYRKVFGGAPPSGEWAIAYYETLASTAGGWEKATAALEQLRRQHPDAAEYKLSLGRLYTYKPATRLQGMELLESVGGDNILSSRAQQAWRQALVWENGSARSEASLKAYLSRYPDAELATLLKQTDNVHVRELAGGPEAQRGYRALKQNQLDAAERSFQDALRANPKQAAARTGLGFVRMKQENFAAAVTEFEAALALTPANRVLRDALKEARFWLSLKQGGAALREQRTAEADQLFRNALEARPDDKAALEGYAGALLQANKPAEAVPVLEKLVKADTANANAWKMLARAKQQTSGAAAALETVRAMPPAVSASLNNDLDFTVFLTSTYREAGETGRARELFRRTAELVKSRHQEMTPGLRLQVAALYEAHGEPLESAALYKLAIDSEPENLAAWEGFLSAMNRAHQPEKAFRALEQLPPAVHEQAQARPGFLRLVATLASSMKNFERAEQLANRAAELESQAGDKPSWYTKLLLAQIWTEQGKPEQALKAYAELTRSNPAELDVWKGLILALHRAERYQDVTALVHSLPSDVAAGLNNDADYLGLVANAFRETGDNAEALELLRGVRKPLPPELVPQMAWLLLGNPGSERELFLLLREARGRADLSAAQKKDLSDVWASWILRTADASRTSGDMARTVAILQGGVRLLPADARIQRQLAAALVEIGETRQALVLFKKIGFQGATAADYLAAIGGAMSEKDNRTVELWLADAMRAYPREPEILNLAGKQAASKGDYKTAQVMWRSALQILQAQEREQAMNQLRGKLGNLPDLKPGDAVDDVATLLLGDAPPAKEAKERRPVEAALRLPWETNGAPAATGVDALIDQIVEGSVSTAESVQPAPAAVSQLDRMIEALDSQTPSVKDGKPVDSFASGLLELSTKTKAPVADEKGAMVLSEIETLESRNTPYAGLGGAFQSRGGQGGFDKFLVQESNFEVSGMWGSRVRVGVLGRTVFADSGVADGTNTLRFGMLPVGDTFSSQSVNGVGGEVQLSTESFGLRFGSTPRSFLVPNLIGGLRFRPGNGPITISFDRDSVRDTMLSYTGARDPLSGRVWGGVVTNAAALGGSFGSEKAGAYFNISFHHLTGESVATNKRLDGTFGTYWRLVTTPYGSLNAGLNLFAMHYEKNLRYFTLGHGGYFSPQRFILFNAPVAWTGRWRRLEYSAGTSIGSQSFNEDASPFFPTDSLLQGKAGPYYPEFSSSGVNYNADFRAAYQIAESWHLGGFLNVNNARYYSMQSAGVFVRYAFRPRPLMTDFSVPSIPDWRGRQPFGLQ